MPDAIGGTPVLRLSKTTRLLVSSSICWTGVVDPTIKFTPIDSFHVASARKNVSFAGSVEKFFPWPAVLVLYLIVYPPLLFVFIKRGSATTTVSTVGLKSKAASNTE